MKTALNTAIVVGACLMVGAATANAGVNPAEGGPSSKPSPGKVCILSIDASPDDCSMTRAEANAKAADALAKGENPKGWAQVPPKLAEAARKSQRDPKGKRAQDTQDYYTTIYSNINMGGNYGYMGYTGNDYWRNFSSTWNNVASSAAGRRVWNTYFHEGSDGQGYYYAGLTSGRLIYDFRNANWQGTSVNLNDRASSWKIY